MNDVLYGQDKNHRVTTKAQKDMAIVNNGMKWKGCIRKRSELNLRQYHAICLEGLRKEPQ